MDCCSFNDLSGDSTKKAYGWDMAAWKIQNLERFGTFN